MRSIANQSNHRTAARSAGDERMSDYAFGSSNRPTCETDILKKNIGNLFEHRIIIFEFNGEKVKAIMKEPDPSLEFPCWIKALEWRPEGLFARCGWTPAAKAAIQAKEYKYISESRRRAFPDDLSVSPGCSGSLNDRLEKPRRYAPRF
jgi:hypothetical protein